MQRLANKKIISGQYCEFIAFALHGEFSQSFKEKFKKKIKRRNESELDRSLSFAFKLVCKYLRYVVLGFL